MLLKQPSVLGATQLLTGANVSYHIIIDDLQRNIDAENPSAEAIQQLQLRKGTRGVNKKTQRKLGKTNQISVRACKVSNKVFSIALLAYMRPQQVWIENRGSLLPIYAPRPRQVRTMMTPFGGRKASLTRRGLIAFWHAIRHSKYSICFAWFKFALNGVEDMNYVLKMCFTWRVRRAMQHLRQSTT